MRRAALIGLVISVMSIFSVQFAQAAEETVVANSSAGFKAQITKATIIVGSFEPIVLEGLSSSYAKGSVDSDGNISIPSGSVSIESVSIPSTTLGVTFVIKLISAGTWTGQIDPSTGQVALRMKLYVQLQSPFSCNIGPIDVNRGLTTASGGSSYNSSDGTFTVANSSFTVDPLGSSDCSGAGSTLNNFVGLPVTPGEGGVVFSFKLSTPLVSGGKTLGTLESSEAGGPDFEYLSESSNSSGSSSGSSSKTKTTNNFADASDLSGESLKLSVSASKKQSAKRKKVKATVGCTQDCRVSAWLSIKRKGRKLRSEKIEAIIDADDEKTLNIKLSKRQRRLVSAARTGGHKTKGTLVVQATDGDNELEKTKSLYLK